MQQECIDFLVQYKIFMIYEAKYNDFSTAKDNVKIFKELCNSKFYKAMQYCILQKIGAANNEQKESIYFSKININ